MSSLRLARDPATTAHARPSCTVATAAEILAADPSTVRKLVRAGTLEAHRLGKRGVRIYLDAITAYQDARRVAPAGAPSAPYQAPKKPNRTSSLAHREAVAFLEAEDIV